MSSRLITSPGVQHDFRDDLELSIYVLLWMTLMYSEVSDKDQVPVFLATVSDIQPYNHSGGFTRSDFLKGRTFLQEVKFPDRPALHKLINNLAILFASRYMVVPTPEQRNISDRLWVVAENSHDPAIYEQDYCKTYDALVAKLNNHTATIEYFESALKDHSKWPSNDLPVKQVFHPEPSSEPVRKTGWSTTLYVEEIVEDVHKK